MAQYDGYVRISTQNDTSDAVKATEQLGDEIAKAMDTTPVDKMSDSLDDVGKAALDAGDIVKANLVSDVVLKGVQQLGEGLKCVAEAADGLDSAARRVATATNLSAEELANLQDVIEEIYGDNYGDSLDDIADGISAIKQNLGELDNRQLVEITESAYALRDVFDYDIAGSSRAVKAMTQNFGISAAEAYDYIARGAQNGLDYSGELLDSISEYSVQFAKMGLSASDMFSIFSSGAENGAWNLDKVGDSVKELAIRVIDGSDTSKQGFEALGLSADSMAARFAAGGDTARSAFIEVITALAEMDDPIAQNTAGINLMGTMWEDMGSDAVLALGNITDSAYEAAGAVDGIKDLNYNSLSDSLDTLKRKLELTFEPVGEFAVGTLKVLIDNINLVGAGLAGVTAGMVAFKAAGVVTKVIASWQSAALQVTLFSNAQGAAALKTAALNGTLTKQEIIYAVLGGKLDAATAKQALLNTTMSANPAGAVAAAIGLLVSGLTLFSAGVGESVDKLQEYTAAAQEAREAAEDYADSADNLRDIQAEYKRITETVDDTAAKKEALKNIQQQLVDQYGEQASGIDLVNGAYDEQIEKIRTLISENESLARVQAEQSYESTKKAEDATVAIHYKANAFGWFDKTGLNSSDKAEQQAASLMKKVLVDQYGASEDYFNGYINLNGTFDEKIEAVRAAYDNLSAAGLAGTDIASALADTLSNLESAAKDKAKAEALWTDINADPDTTSSTYTTGNWIAIEEQRKWEKNQQEREERFALLEEQRKQEREANAELYKSARKDAKYAYDMGEIDAATYYATLAELRDSYLEEGSEEWQDVNVELHKYYTSLSDNQQKALTEAYNEEKSLLKYYYRTGKMTEEQYYQQLAKIRDKYLDKNSDAWRSAYLETYEYNQRIVQENKDSLTQLLTDTSDTTLSALENIISARDSLTSRLVDFNKTFEKITETVPETIAVKGEFTVTTSEHEVEVYRMGADSIEDNIKVLEEYGAMLDALKARGADDDTLNNILAMDVDEAMEFGSSLLSMSDKAWNDYFDSMAKLRQTAADISAQYYQGEVDSLRDNFVDKLREELEGLGDDMYLVGADVAAEFVSGWNEAMGTQDLTIGQLVQSLSGTVSTAPAAAQQMISMSEATTVGKDKNGNATSYVVPVYIGTSKIAEVMIDAINGEIIRTGKNVLLT